MSERQDIVLSEAEGPNPPGVLKQIAEEIGRELPRTPGYGGSWLRGKSEQEVARAQAIKAEVLAKAAEIDLARERLVHERAMTARAAAQEDQKVKNAHLERMYQLQTERFQAVIQAVHKLHSMEVRVDVQAMLSLLSAVNPAAVHDNTPASVGELGGAPNVVPALSDPEASNGDDGGGAV